MKLYVKRHPESQLMYTYSLHERNGRVGMVTSSQVADWKELREAVMRVANAVYAEKGIIRKDKVAQVNPGVEK